MIHLSNHLAFFIINKRGFYFLLFTLLLFFLSPVFAGEIEYNQECVTPVINGDWNLDLYGKGEYYPYLVEDEEGNYSVKVRTIGNWSKHLDKMRFRVQVYCDEWKGNTHNVQTFNDYSIYPEDGAVITEFSRESTFHIPPGNRRCTVLLTDVYLLNESWSQEHGCGNYFRCSCFIQGLSGKPPHRISERVLTLQEYQTWISIQRAEDRAWDGYMISFASGIVGAILGGIAAIAGSVCVQKREWEKKKREEKVQIMKKIYDNLSRIKLELKKDPPYYYSLSEDRFDELKLSSKFLLLDDGIQELVKNTMTKLKDFKNNCFEERSSMDDLKTLKSDQVSQEKLSDLNSHLDRVISKLADEIKEG